MTGYVTLAKTGTTGAQTETIGDDPSRPLYVTSSGPSDPIEVQGNVSAGVTDTGNPVKVGAVYNTTLPTYTTGQRTDVQAGTRGSLNVTLFAQDSASAVAVGSSTADALSFSNQGLNVRSIAYLFGGATTGDRARSVGGAANTQGTGAAAVGLPLWSQSDLSAVRINTASAGDTTLVAAVASQTTRVHAMRISVAGAVVVQVKDGAGSILEVFDFAGNGGSVFLDLRDRPYYRTTVNTAFIINLSAAVQVNGRLEYVTSA